MLGKMYDQGVAAGQIKPAVKDDPAAEGSADDDVEPNGAQGNGKAKPGAGRRAAKATAAKGPDGSRSTARDRTATARAEGMSPGARRKKRKR